MFRYTHVTVNGFVKEVKITDGTASVTIESEDGDIVTHTTKVKERVQDIIREDLSVTNPVVMTIAVSRQNQKEYLFSVIKYK